MRMYRVPVDSTVGISIEEYERRWQAILVKYGADYARNQGWGPDHLSYAGTNKAGRLMVINVPHGNRLTPEAREAIIRDAEAQFA